MSDWLRRLTPGLGTHTRAGELAARRMDEPLASADEAWLNAHLGSCDRCRSIAADYAAQRSALHALRNARPEPPRDLWARTAAAIDAHPAPGARANGRGWLPLAPAAGLLVVALAVLGVLNGGRRCCPARALSPRRRRSRSPAACFGWSAAQRTDRSRSSPGSSTRYAPWGRPAAGCPPPWTSPSPRGWRVMPGSLGSSRRRRITSWSSSVVRVRSGCTWWRCHTRRRAAQRPRHPRRAGRPRPRRRRRPGRRPRRPARLRRPPSLAPPLGRPRSPSPTASDVPTQPASESPSVAPSDTGSPSGSPSAPPDGSEAPDAGTERCGLAGARRRARDRERRDGGRIRSGLLGRWKRVCVLGATSGWLCRSRRLRVAGERCACGRGDQ